MIFSLKKLTESQGQKTLERDEKYAQNKQQRHRNGVAVARTYLYFFKGYLRYKKKTSENVAPEENVLFHRGVMFGS